MLVKSKKNLVTNEGKSLIAGKPIDLPEAIAKRLIDAGLAVETTEVKVKTMKAVASASTSGGIWVDRKDVAATKPSKTDVTVEAKAEMTKVSPKRTKAKLPKASAATKAVCLDDAFAKIPSAE